jgi:DNA modification methylase
MIYTGDCLDVLKTLPADSVDAIVTDPPYGLSFMGKRWDYDVPSEAIWRECLRVLKPGGYLLAFAGTRTQHRMAVRIEDAGFEIRDMIAWVYGSGFPKSLDVSKAIDKAAGAVREVVGQYTVSRDLSGGSWADLHGQENAAKQHNITAPATEAARQWAGWGTALKPALEPITVARKPLIGTVAENVLAHGTGALNVDGCRVEGRERTDYGLTNSTRSAGNTYGKPSVSANFDANQGRWPANLIHDGSDEVAGLFPDTKGGTAVRRNSGGHTFGGIFPKPPMDDLGYGDSGSAARFFYCAKASAKDRDEGVAGVAGVAGVGALRDGGRQSLPRKNHHPTVKPTALMQYLCRLVTPPGGTVLDPFMGSGSTGKAAMLEGFDFIGIERDPEYVKIAEARISAACRLL